MKLVNCKWVEEEEDILYGVGFCKVGAKHQFDVKSIKEERDAIMKEKTKYKRENTRLKKELLKLQDKYKRMEEMYIESIRGN